MEDKNSISKASSMNVLASTLVTLLALILAPLIGIFLLSRKSLKWNKIVKILVGALTLIYIPFHALTLFYLFIVGGIYYIGPHDAQALQYLESRYHQEFVIGDSAGSDQLGGSHTYNKWATPKSDPDLRFRVYRCLAKCRPYESTEFKDYYAQRKWSKELTAVFVKQFAEKNKKSISVAANSSDTDAIVNTHSGKDFEFGELSDTDKQKIGLSVTYSESDGAYNYKTREQHAKRILEISSFIKSTGAGSSDLTYNIRAKTPRSVSHPNSKDTFHFESDNPTDLEQVSDVYPLFIVYTYGRGAVKSGYEARQTQLNTSKRQTSAATGKPSADVADKAGKELEIAEGIRNKISKDYLVAPYVVATINPSQSVGTKSISYDELKPSDYTLEVTIYNYPDETVPISSERHRVNVQVLSEMLKKDFQSSRLTYKSDLPTCKVQAIDKNTSIVNVASSCFN